VSNVLTFRPLLCTYCDAVRYAELAWYLLGHHSFCTSTGLKPWYCGIRSACSPLVIDHDPCTIIGDDGQGGTIISPQSEDVVCFYALIFSLLPVGIRYFLSADSHQPHYSTDVRGSWTVQMQSSRSNFAMLLASKVPYWDTAPHHRNGFSPTKPIERAHCASHR